MIHVLVMHESPSVGNAIATFLHDKPKINVIGTITARESACIYLESQPCDIILVSDRLPDCAALHVAHCVMRKAYATKVLIIDVPNSPAMVLHYLEEGIAGYAYENESLDNLLEKVYALSQNEFTLCPAITVALMNRISALKRLARLKKSTQISEQSNSFMTLTAREREVFTLLALGCTNQEIADTLVIEVGTVKSHVNHILRKLDIHKREDTVLLAQQVAMQSAPTAHLKAQNI